MEESAAHKLVGCFIQWASSITTGAGFWCPGALGRAPFPVGLVASLDIVNPKSGPGFLLGSLNNWVKCSTFFVPERL